MIHSNKDKLTTQLLQLIDAGLVFLSFVAADLLQDPLRRLLGRVEGRDYALMDMSWVLFLAVPLTPFVLARFGFYRRVRWKSTARCLGQLVRGGIVIALVLSVFALLSKADDTRRLVILIGGAGVFFSLFFRDRLFRYRASRRRISGRHRERIIIAGTELEISHFLEQADEELLKEFRIVAHFDLTAKSRDEFFDLLKAKAVARVVFVNEETSFATVSKAVEVCELQGVEAWIAASFVKTQIARPVFDSMGNEPMLVLRSTPELSWELLMKTLMDRLGAFTVLLMTLPLCVIAAIGIKLASPGAPVFFTQMRAGRYGEPFRMWKFRTMVANAEELLETLKEDAGNDMDGPVFKLERDPRIFAFGALLRKLSIDELPQLWNVVRGDMSLVGPRPLPLYEVEAFDQMHYRRRLSVRPGITCEWQVGGRNKITSFDDWVAMDLNYIDNWSLWLDFKILLRTVPAVILGRGAK